MSIVLDIRDLTRVHGQGESEVHALRGVSLQVAAGELVAVMGPSGSGKSTLLTIAGGLDSPTGGTVTIEGSEIGGLSRKDLAALRRRSVGYVFQDFNLIPALTAAENVALPRELDGDSTRAARKLALIALEEVGIPELADRFPDDMSGGQQQRVAIARAIVGDRRLVLADEPTGALDTETGEQVLRLLRARCDAGCGRRARHSRGTARGLGRPGRVPARRPDDRRDGPRARGRIAARRRHPRMRQTVAELAPGAAHRPSRRHPRTGTQRARTRDDRAAGAGDRLPRHAHPHDRRVRPGRAQPPTGFGRCAGHLLRRDLADRPGPGGYGVRQQPAGREDPATAGADRRHDPIGAGSRHQGHRDPRGRRLGADADRAGPAGCHGARSAQPDDGRAFPAHVRTVPARHR